jgi:hypothetical protein
MIGRKSKKQSSEHSDLPGKKTLGEKINKKY